MDLSASAQFWVNLLLLWIGFGTVVGLIARTILPDGEPRGMFGTLVIGVAGSCLGPLIVSLIWKPDVFNPIGPVGLTVSVLSSLVLFLLYRFVFSFFKRREGADNGL